MPLNQLSNTAKLRNKENNSQLDHQSSLATSPKKNPLNKSSPSKNLSKQIKQITQLKIRLSDREFELKKLEEDCVVKLATMQKQLTREKNEKKNLIKQYKDKIEQDKQYFQTRMIGIEEEWKKKLSQAQEGIRKKIEQKFDQQMKLTKCSQELKIQQLKSQIQEVKKRHMAEKKSLIQIHSSQLNNLCVKLSKQKQQLQQKSEQDITQLKHQHLSQMQFYHQVQEQKAKQNNVVLKILTDKIRNIEEELRLTKEKLKQLTAQLAAKEEELFIQRRTKEDYRLDKICLERKLARLEPQIMQQHQKLLSQAKHQYENSLKEHIKKSSQQLSHLQQLQNQSISNYTLQLQQMEERCKQVVLLHETIKSNENDLKKIQMLEIKLLKKEMQLQKQREYIKMCKLQLSNMDQIYQKMFEQAKLKSLRPKKQRLPSLLSVGQNRSTMDAYNTQINESTRQKKKFSIREVINKSKDFTKDFTKDLAKDLRQLHTEFAPYQ